MKGLLTIELVIVLYNSSGLSTLALNYMQKDRKVDRGGRLGMEVMS